MATKKASSNLQISNVDTYIPPTKEGRQEKKEGRVVTLTKPFKIYGQKLLERRSKLMECNDGWFKIYDEFEREVVHYRVGLKAFKEILEAEATPAI